MPNFFCLLVVAAYHVLLEETWVCGLQHQEHLVQAVCGHCDPLLSTGSGLCGHLLHRVIGESGSGSANQRREPKWAVSNQKGKRTALVDGSGVEDRLGNVLQNTSVRCRGFVN